MDSNDGDIGLHFPNVTIYMSRETTDMLLEDIAEIRNPTPKPDPFGDPDDWQPTRPDTRDPLFAVRCHLYHDGYCDRCGCQMGKEHAAFCRVGDLEAALTNQAATEAQAPDAAQSNIGESYHD